MTNAHVYSGNPLDRGERQRRDESWIESRATDPSSKILPLRDLKILISNIERPELGWLTPQDFDHLKVGPTKIFLGLLDDIAHFATDVSKIQEAGEFETTTLQFEDARTAAGIVSHTDAGIIAHARSHIGWHNRHGFCSVCGHPTTIARGGQVRQCANCNAEHFPRTDPVIIVVVSHQDQCLLGQSWGRLRKSNMYSALAGFIDQGESIEEAVAREVVEEAGVPTMNIRYHSSQPWPFPSSLMIGCHADACTTEILKNEEEMADVRWFGRDEILSALDGRNETLSLPGPFAIAHHLIRSWALKS